MTAAERLTKIKAALYITDSYHDVALQVHIDDTMNDMKQSGIAASFVEDDAAVGIILQGVKDIMRLDGGAANYSQLYKDKVIKAALAHPSDEVQTGGSEA